ncbi:MAG: hypothetical protein H0X37_26180 [Herpetosiphonaceae bacterium]|nr:hypothetical protein [Herpetosiphonaceae bacterium]
MRVSAAAAAEVLVLDRDAFLSFVAEFDLIDGERAALVRRAISGHLARALPMLN